MSQSPIEQSSLIVQDKRSASLPDVYQQQMTPMQELQMQIVRTGDLEKLKQLREIEREWREDQARQSFNKAFAAFKSEAVKLVRTKLITDGPLKNKKHVELGEIVRVATPSLSKYGLSISWKLTKDDKDWMEVTCTLRHEDGHSESVSMGGAPDTGPGRNAIQARGSSKTYLERYTATAILGLAPEDDDDGNGGPKSKEDYMPDDKVEEWCDAMRQAPDINQLKPVFSQCYNIAKKLGDESAKKQFVAVYEESKRKVGGTQ